MGEVVSRQHLDWALGYDGYRRLAGSPAKLEKLLRSARNSYTASGRVPEWCGVDFLRGWAFYLARADYFAGGGTFGREWVDVLQALDGHPDAGPTDRPPRAGAALPTKAISTTGALPSEFSQAPKMHRDPAFLQAKRERLYEPHVEPINRYVDGIADERDAPVPYVDPDSGGVLAEVLFVLESPAGPAALGSGMLSADNDDETAKNIWNAYVESGLPRTAGLHWNAVPWYTGSAAKNGKVSSLDVVAGRSYLLRLLDLAPEVRVVVAMGKKAQASVSGAADALEERGILLIEAPHPGPIPAGVTGGESLRAVADAFRAARSALE